MPGKTSSESIRVKNIYSNMDSTWSLRSIVCLASPASFGFEIFFEEKDRGQCNERSTISVSRKTRQVLRDSRRSRVKRDESTSLERNESSLERDETTLKRNETTLKRRSNL